MLGCSQWYLLAILSNEEERVENEGPFGLTLETFAKDLKFIDIFVRFQNSGIRFEIGFIDIEITALVIVVVILVIKSIAGHFVIRHFAFQFLHEIIFVFDILIFTIFDF